MTKHSWPVPVFDFARITALTGDDTSGKVLRALSPETRVIAASLLSEMDKLRYWRFNGDFLSQPQVEQLFDALQTAVHEIIFDVDINPIDEDGCYWIPTTHGAIDWYPNHPHADNASDFNYPFPDEQLQIKWDSPSGWLEETFLNLVGIHPDDALCYWSLFTGDASGYDDSSFEGLGLPYFRLKFTASEGGIIQFHLLDIPYGGLAIAIVDGNPLTTSIHNLAVDPVEVADPELGAADIVNVAIDEMSFSAGTHEFIVYMSPFVDDAPPWLLFGGGLRGIRICTAGDLIIGYTEEDMDAQIITILQDIRDTLNACVCTFLGEQTLLQREIKSNVSLIASVLSEGTQSVDDDDTFWDKVLDIQANKTGIFGDQIQYSTMYGKTVITDGSSKENAELCRALTWLILTHMSKFRVKLFHTANYEFMIDFERANGTFRFDDGIQVPMTQDVSDTLFLHGVTYDAEYTDEQLRMFLCSAYGYLLANPTFNQNDAGLGTESLGYKNWRNAIRAYGDYLNSLPDEPAPGLKLASQLLFNISAITQNYLFFLRYLHYEKYRTSGTGLATNDDCSCLGAVASPDVFEFLETGEGWTAGNEYTQYQTSVGHPSNGGFYKLTQDATLDLWYTLPAVSDVSRIDAELVFFNQYSGRYAQAILYTASDELIDSRLVYLPQGTYTTDKPFKGSFTFDADNAASKVRLVIYNWVNTMFLEKVVINYYE